MRWGALDGFELGSYFTWPDSHFKDHYGCCVSKTVARKGLKQKIQLRDKSIIQERDDGSLDQGGESGMEKVIGFRVYFVSRANRIYWWHGCRVWEKERDQGWLQWVLLKEMKVWGCCLLRWGSPGKNRFEREDQEFNLGHVKLDHKLDYKLWTDGGCVFFPIIVTSVPDRCINTHWEKSLT